MPPRLSTSDPHFTEKEPEAQGLLRNSLMDKMRTVRAYLLKQTNEIGPCDSNPTWQMGLEVIVPIYTKLIKHLF